MREADGCEGQVARAAASSKPGGGKRQMGSRDRMSLHRRLQAGSRHLCRDMREHADMHAEGTATRKATAAPPPRPQKSPPSPRYPVRRDHPRTHGSVSLATEGSVSLATEPEGPETIVLRKPQPRAASKGCQQRAQGARRSLRSHGFRLIPPQLPAWPVDRQIACTPPAKPGQVH